MKKIWSDWILRHSPDLGPFTPAHAGCAGMMTNGLLLHEVIDSVTQRLSLTQKGQMTAIAFKFKSIGMQVFRKRFGRFRIDRKILPCPDDQSHTGIISL